MVSAIALQEKLGPRVQLSATNLRAEPAFCEVVFVAFTLQRLHLSTGVT